MCVCVCVCVSTQAVWAGFRRFGSLGGVGAGGCPRVCVCVCMCVSVCVCVCV